MKLTKQFNLCNLLSKNLSLFNETEQQHCLNPLKLSAPSRFSQCTYLLCLLQYPLTRLHSATPLLRSSAYFGS